MSELPKFIWATGNNISGEWDNSDDTDADLQTEFVRKDVVDRMANALHGLIEVTREPSDELAEAEAVLEDYIGVRLSPVQIALAKRLGIYPEEGE